MYILNATNMTEIEARYPSLLELLRAKVLECYTPEKLGISANPQLLYCLSAFIDRLLVLGLESVSGRIMVQRNQEQSLILRAARYQAMLEECSNYELYYTMIRVKVAVARAQGNDVDVELRTEIENECAEDYMTLLLLCITEQYG